MLGVPLPLSLFWGEQADATQDYSLVPCQSRPPTLLRAFFGRHCVLTSVLLIQRMNRASSLLSWLQLHCCPVVVSSPALHFAGFSPSWDNLLVCSGCFIFLLLYLFRHFNFHLLLLGGLLYLPLFSYGLLTMDGISSSLDLVLSLVDININFNICFISIPACNYFGSQHLAYSILFQ